MNETADTERSARQQQISAQSNIASHVWGEQMTKYGSINR